MEFTIDARDAGEGLLTVQILVSDPSTQTGINWGWNVFRANAENLRWEPSETSCDQRCVAIQLIQCETYKHIVYPSEHKRDEKQAPPLNTGPRAQLALQLKR